MRELYGVYYRRLAGQLSAACGDLAKAEDAGQEAFVRAGREIQRSHSSTTQGRGCAPSR